MPAWVVRLVHCVDPFVAKATTSGLRYYRLHGVGGYRHRYSDEELAALKGWMPSRGEAWCMFNNVGMWDDARRFAALFKT